VTLGDGADHIVVVQRTDSTDPATPPPPRVAAALAHAPPRVTVLHRINACYDWGAFGWALGQQAAKRKKYKFWVMLNSSVRGPFPGPSALATPPTPWHRIFTTRLGGADGARMVGPVVSCEASPRKGVASGDWRATPHVQSWLIALDRVGLDVLKADGHALACAGDRWDAIWHGELGASAAILASGHNLACLLPRYAGVDWRDSAAAGCNQRTSPVGDGYFDGVTLSPSDTVFVKYKARLLHARHPAALAARTLSRWEDEKLLAGVADVGTNAWVSDPATHKAPRVAAALSRGAPCFDAAYYRAANPDLAHLDDGAAFRHAALWGQFETRDLAWTCPAAAIPPDLVSAMEAAHAAGKGPPPAGAPRPRVVGGRVGRAAPRRAGAVAL
jgi:translation initiation factor eIF-2B subunit epsilon